MKKTIFFLITFMLLWSCEKESIKSGIDDDGLIAQIVAYDMNCSSCIVEFPYDSIYVKNTIGASPQNRYEAINLNKSDFRIGQLIKLKLRKPLRDEFRACITLYPSYNYTGIYVTELNDIKTLELNNINFLRYNDCLYNSENDSYICLDSVLSDSRCPPDAICFWAGMAEVKFRSLKLTGIDEYFVLNTNPAFRNDTIINGFKYTLISLRPAPEIDQRTRQEFYSAEIKVEKP